MSWFTPWVVSRFAGRPGGKQTMNRGGGWPVQQFLNDISDLSGGAANRRPALTGLAQHIPRVIRGIFTVTIMVGLNIVIAALLGFSSALCAGASIGMRGNVPMAWLAVAMAAGSMQTLVMTLFSGGTSDLAG